MGRATALIRDSDARRLARIAKAEGVVVSVKVAGNEITFSPDIPVSHRAAKVEQEEEIVL